MSACTLMTPAKRNQPTCSLLLQLCVSPRLGSSLMDELHRYEQSNPLPKLRQSRKRPLLTTSETTPFHHSETLLPNQTSRS